MQFHKVRIESEFNVMLGKGDFGVALENTEVYTVTDIGGTAVIYQYGGELFLIKLPKHVVAPVIRAFKGDDEVIKDLKVRLDNTARDLTTASREAEEYKKYIVPNLEIQIEKLLAERELLQEKFTHQVSTDYLAKEKELDEYKRAVKNLLIENEGLKMKLLSKAEELKRIEARQLSEQHPVCGYAQFEKESIKYDELTMLAGEVFQANKEKGFWSEDVTQRNRGELLALMHSELSEALEADRKNLMDDKLPEYKGFDVELADCLIRILDTCGAFEIPIGEIVQKKLAYNATRAYKHGKNY